MKRESRRISLRHWRDEMSNEANYTRASTSSTTGENNFERGNGAHRIFPLLFLPVAPLSRLIVASIEQSWSWRIRDLSIAPMPEHSPNLGCSPVILVFKYGYLSCRICMYVLNFFVLKEFEYSVLTTNAIREFKIRYVVRALTLLA